jgi:hypothetical protein
MSRLTKQIKAKGKAPSGHREQSAIPLAGEPPAAVSHGWGDMSWWYRRHQPQSSPGVCCPP